MRAYIREQLEQLADEKYRDFSASLVPGETTMLGVRLPALRKLAKQILKGNAGYLDWREELRDNEEGQDIYFEEVMLRGMLIGYGTDKENDIFSALELFAAYIPKITNWSLCDSVCTTFQIAGRFQEQTWEYLQPYLYSAKEFEVRAGLILLLDYFTRVDAAGKKIPRKKSVVIQDLQMREYGIYTQRILETVNRAFLQGYYAQMAAAWLTAELFVVFPGAVYCMLSEANQMDAVTYRMTIRKIGESRIPDQETKQAVRALLTKGTVRV